MFVPSLFNFSPHLIENGFLSSLKRTAFVIELDENVYIANLILNEEIKDTEFYWCNMFKPELQGDYAISNP